MSFTLVRDKTRKEPCDENSSPLYSALAHPLHERCFAIATSRPFLLPVFTNDVEVSVLRRSHVGNYRTFEPKFANISTKFGDRFIRVLTQTIKPLRGKESE